jgi:hypothetical protein
MERMPEFADVSRESVRDYWADEARESIPWLAEQIGTGESSKIDDRSQLEITLNGIEQRVERSTLDSLAEATDGLS